MTNEHTSINAFIIQRLKQAICTLINGEKFKIPATTLHNFTRLFSEICDKVILETCQIKKFSYLGGRFVIKKLPNDVFIFYILLYFENEQGKYIEEKVDLSSSLAETKISKQFLPADQLELNNLGEIIFEISPPNE